jgi:hypothetical protein
MGVHDRIPSGPAISRHMVSSEVCRRSLRNSILYLDQLGRASSKSLTWHAGNPRTTTFIRPSDQLRRKSKPPPPSPEPQSRLTLCRQSNPNWMSPLHYRSSTRGGIASPTSSIPYDREQERKPVLPVRATHTRDRALALDRIAQVKALLAQIGAQIRPRSSLNAA